MKNKRLPLIIGGLVALIALAIGSQFLTPEKEAATDGPAKVGVLQFVTHEALDEIYRGIQAGLEAEGYAKDKIAIEFLNAQGDQSKVQTMSQTLVKSDNEVLIGIATPAAQGLASATKDTPIIMGAVTDPVGAKLVKDLKKPDGNVTGVSDQTPVAAQIDLIKAVTPEVKTIGVIYSSSEDNSASQVETFKALAEKAGYTVVVKSVPSTNEIQTTLSVLVSEVDALWVPLDNTIASAFSTVVSAVKEAKKPIFPSVDTMVAEGGLASVVIDQFELGVATGKMVAKVLKGEAVTNLPVEVFNQGKPIINQKVAKELGIVIPEEVVKTAATVIE